MKAVVVALVAALCLSFAVAQQCDPASANTSPSGSVCGYGFCDSATLSCKCYTGYVSNRTGCYDCAQGYTLRSDGTCVMVENNPCLDKDCGQGSCVVVQLATGPAAKCACFAGWANEGLPNTTCSRCAPGYTLTNGACVLSTSNPCGTVNDPCTRIPNTMCLFSSNGAQCVCKDGYVRDPATGACVLRDTTGGCPSTNPCNHGTCFPNTASPLGYGCQCEPGWAHLIVTNTDGTQSVRFCSTCAAGFIPSRTLNPDTQLYDVTCVPASPCSTVNCGINGYCDDSTGQAICKCRYNFAPRDAATPTSPCDICATGYTNPAADSGLAPCSVCATGFTAVGSLCFPSDQTNTCPVSCGQYGQCRQLDSGAYVCVCAERYMNDPADPVRRPCSVCRDGVSDPSAGCAPPSNFTTCMEACRAKDPNSVCVAASSTITGANTFLGFKCVCAPRYVADERGLCTKCAPGYYSTDAGACVESRCPGGCNLGQCVGDFSTPVPTFKCVCPLGYSGESCLTYTPPTTPCNGQCTTNQVCVNAETAVLTAGTSTFETATIQRCICKRNFVDDIRADGSAVRCGKCAAGWAGAECNIPALADQSACANVVCPEPSICTVLQRNLTSTEFVTRCLCKDGTPFRPETRCGLVSDIPDANTCPVTCPANAECVRSGLTTSGARCICKAGYRPSQASDGSVVCVPERPVSECPLACGEDQVCISSLDFTSSAVSQTPKCICRSPNAYMNNNGTCVCRPGWFGPYCGRRINPCDTLGSRCPPRSVCVPVESSDESLSYKCVCAGSFSGQDCSIDLCALRNSPCPEGTRCNKDGQCVCPLNQLLDSNNRCVDRPRELPTGFVNTTCSDATRATCILPPPTRDINRTRDNADDKELTLTRPRVGGDNTVDNFGINFRTNNGAVFAVCIRRVLGLSNTDIRVAIRVCLRLVALEIFEIPAAGTVSDQGTSVRNITIGETSNTGYDTRTSIVEKDISTPGVKAHAFTIRTADGILRLQCFVANVSKAVEDTVTTPNVVHCNLHLSVPSVYYNTPRSKVCFRLFAEKDSSAGNNDGVFSIKSDADTSRISYFPLRNGAPIGTGADLSFENFAWVGNARVGVTYTAVPDASGFVIRGCFNTFNPDEVKLDPSMGADGAYDAGSNTNAPVSSGSNAPTKSGGVTGASSAVSVSAMLILAFVALVALLF